MVKRYVDKNLCHYYNGDVHQYTERNINGLTEWEEYDSDHRIVNYKNSDGVSRVHQYTNGRETFFREEREGVYTYELWREYDAAGRETHRRDNRGTEWWKTYDDAGRETYYKSGGIERERAYDANGREIRRKESGKVVFEKRFDAKGRVEYYNDGKEAWTRPADKNVDDPKPFAAAEVGGR